MLVSINSSFSVLKCRNTCVGSVRQSGPIVTEISLQCNWYYLPGQYVISKVEAVSNFHSPCTINGPRLIQLTWLSGTILHLLYAEVQGHPSTNRKMLNSNAKYRSKRSSVLYKMQNGACHIKCSILRCTRRISYKLFAISFWWVEVWN